MVDFNICVTRFGVTTRIWEEDEPDSSFHERLKYPRRTTDHVGDHAAMPAYPHSVWQHPRQGRRQ